MSMEIEFYLTLFTIILCACSEITLFQNGAGIHSFRNAILAIQPEHFYNVTGSLTYVKFLGDCQFDPEKTILPPNELKDLPNIIFTHWPTCHGCETYADIGRQLPSIEKFVEAHGFPSAKIIVVNSFDLLDNKNFGIVHFFKLIRENRNGFNFTEIALPDAKIIQNTFRDDNSIQLRIVQELGPSYALYTLPFVIFKSVLTVTGSAILYFSILALSATIERHGVSFVRDNILMFLISLSSFITTFFWFDSIGSLPGEILSRTGIIIENILTSYIILLWTELFLRLSFKIRHLMIIRAIIIIPMLMFTLVYIIAMLNFIPFFFNIISSIPSMITMCGLINNSVHFLLMLHYGRKFLVFSRDWVNQPVLKYRMRKFTVLIFFNVFIKLLQFLSFLFALIFIPSSAYVYTHALQVSLLISSAIFLWTFSMNNSIRLEFNQLEASTKLPIIQVISSTK